LGLSSLQAELNCGKIQPFQQAVENGRC
jgi:hypothetical protein